MEAILNRRSIRKYTDQPIHDRVIRDLLEAAMCAPSAGNERPWHFIVIRDRDTLRKIPQFHPYANMLPGAAAAILVCGDPEKEKHTGCWVQDCSAATENLLIAAQHKNLGAVWLGVYPVEERINGLREVTGVPENIVPFALVALGYPAEKKPVYDRYDESRVRQEKW
ncbi:nitroreductase family protein [bacterium]|nr:nitroreductase family protein [bacterium]